MHNGSVKSFVFQRLIQLIVHPLYMNIQSHQLCIITANSIVEFGSLLTIADRARRGGSRSGRKILRRIARWCVEKTVDIISVIIESDL